MKNLSNLLRYHRAKVAQAKLTLENENRMYPAHAVASASHELQVHAEHVRTLEEFQAELQDDFPLWLHVKRGDGVYAEVGVAIAQCEAPIQDSDHVVLYRGENGAWWIRPPEEFRDGRFVQVEKAEPESGFVHYEGTVIGGYPEALPPPAADGSITLMFVTGVLDDTLMTFSQEQWAGIVGEIVEAARFRLGPSETDKEDYWGEWRVIEAISARGPDKPPVLRVEYT